jgi:hypothetical protein
LLQPSRELKPKVVRFDDVLAAVPVPHETLGVIISVMSGTSMWFRREAHTLASQLVELMGRRSSG